MKQILAGLAGKIMKPKITREFLKEHDACKDGYDWWVENCEGLSDQEQFEKIRKHDFNYTIWLITNSISSQDNVQFAIYCAELSLPIYEKEFPEDKELRSALESLKNNPESKAARNAARNAAGDAAWNAAGDAARAFENNKEIENKILDFGCELMGL